MAVFGERFVLGFTSPRSPYLIQEYIKVIDENKMDDIPYNKSFQEKFYKFLSEAQVAGEMAGNAKDKALAGRDKLTRMPQALGFFITQKGQNFKVTEAGKLLKDNALFEDVLLHQMLKYQLPSCLHRERNTNKGYFKIKPFLELIRLVNVLEYLTYKEMLIFGMTLTNYNRFEETVNKIRQYRTDRKKIKKQKKSIKKFDYETQLNLFTNLYKDIIDSGNIKTRESKTETAEEYMKKKMSNWNDYTDSIFRILRASGIFVFKKGRSLSISPSRQNEVNYMLTHIKRDIEPVDMSRKDFDEYISNPYIPQLLNDNKTNLISSLKKLDGSGSLDDTIYMLKHNLSKKREESRQLKLAKKQSSLKVRSRQDIDDIIDVFNDITNNNIEPSSMRPTLFEWNVWRAMTMINHGNIRGNFIVDDSGMPISTASGGQSDIVGEYSKFNIGVEVTLSQGKKQYEMESEPVTRHIGEMQIKKPSFGIFIADKLQDSVINHFYTVSHQNSRIYNGIVDIIPMDTKTFIDFFKQAIQKDLHPEELFSIHEFSKLISKQMLLDEKTEVDWHTAVLEKAFKVTSIETNNIK